MIGSNPLPILISRHRVIGPGGLLIGQDGGLKTTAALLRLEGILMRQYDRQEKTRLLSDWRNKR